MKILKPGVFLEARVFLNNDTVATLPIEAISWEVNARFIYVKMVELFLKQEVKTRVEKEGRIELLNPEELKGKRL